jgi:uncharacterized repeat protein (TIGR03847 family)
MMDNVIELEDVDGLGAGAIGEPGERAFYIQADKADARLTVLVEKEQVALLAAEAVVFLDRLADDYPEEPLEPLQSDTAAVNEPAIPLFRARMIGLGFEPESARVLIELREHAQEDEEEESEPDDSEGFVARIFATRAQVRAMAANGAQAVASGRPLCQLCNFPMDPEGHICPRWN